MPTRQSRAVQVALALVRAMATDPGSNHTSTRGHVAHLVHTPASHQTLSTQCQQTRHNRFKRNIRMRSKTQSPQWQQTRLPLRTRRTRDANMVAHTERCNLSARTGPTHAEQPNAASWHQTFTPSRTRCAHGAQMVAAAERCNLSAHGTLQPFHTHGHVRNSGVCVCGCVCVCLRRAEDIRPRLVNVHTYVRIRVRTYLRRL